LKCLSLSLQVSEFTDFTYLSNNLQHDRYEAFKRHRDEDRQFRQVYRHYHREREDKYREYLDQQRMSRNLWLGVLQTLRGNLLMPELSDNIAKKYVLLVKRFEKLFIEESLFPSVYDERCVSEVSINQMMLSSQNAKQEKETETERER
jgi:hypothetical protein